MGQDRCDTGCSPSGPLTGGYSSRRVVLEAAAGASRSISLAEEAPSDLAARLLAAKPVTWRGRGDLSQVTWAPVLRGTWLVLDLWAGVSGLCIALLQLGLHFYGIAAECDPQARQVACNNMPSLVHCEKVEELRVSDLVPVLRRRKFRGILMGGGSPCQGNSALNKQRKGLEDDRSCQPELLAALRRELEDLPEAEGLEIVSFLENVQSMPADVRSQYSTWMGGDPVAICSGSCGWVTRNRLYWLVSRSRSISVGQQPPEEWEWEDGVTPPVLSFCGKKPLPQKVHFHQGFQPLFSPLEVMAKKGKGAMYTFTREFYHPTDRVRDVPPEVANRFYEDNCRFPPGAYSDSSLVWKKDVWRTLTPEERSQVMGYPPESFSAVSGNAAARIQAKNSLIGNGFHLYSVMVLFCFLPALLEAKIPAPLVCNDESALQSRLLGTIWEPGRLSQFPGILTAQDVVREMHTMFPLCPVQECIWDRTIQRLSACQLWELQAYFGWCKLHGLETHMLPPSPLLRQDRTRVFAGLSGQRYPGNSSRGLDHLLPPGLGKEGHMEASAKLPSPFRHVAWPELDVAFVIHGLWVWRSHFPTKTAKLRHILRTVARALAPLEDALACHRVESARRVAAGKRPAFMACITALLRWPDVAQSQQLLLGYPIIGEFEHSGIFRVVAATDAMNVNEWFSEGPAAIARIMASRPPLHVEDIYATTMEEQDKGFCSPFLSKAQVDAKFGVGQWRPLERFLIKQPDGKKRVIDNAKKTLHNSCTSLHEMQGQYPPRTLTLLLTWLPISYRPSNYNPARQMTRLFIGSTFVWEQMTCLMLIGGSRLHPNIRLPLLLRFSCLGKVGPSPFCGASPMVWNLQWFLLTGSPSWASQGAEDWYFLCVPATSMMSSAWRCSAIMIAHNAGYNWCLPSWEPPRRTPNGIALQLTGITWEHPCTVAIFTLRCRSWSSLSFLHL